MEIRLSKNQEIALIYFLTALEDHQFDFTKTLIWALNYFNQYRYENEREAFRKLSTYEKNQILAKVAATALGHTKVGAK